MSEKVVIVLGPRLVEIDGVVYEYVPGLGIVE